MLIKEMKKEARAKKDLESIPVKEENVKFKSQLGKFLNENKDEHFNFNVTETFLVSTGSLTLDDALGGGLPPGIHRFGGASEGGKTSASLEVIKNFLSTVPNSKGLIVKAEGRLPEKMKKRSGLKFVDNPDDWEIGTVFVFKCNVYEPVAQLVQDLILDNPENIKYAFLLDSLDGLNLREDLVKSFIGDDNARVCGSPAITKRLFRRLSLPINELCHLFIIICQIIASIPAKFDPKEQLVVGGAGGNAAIHFSNWSLKFLPHYKGDLIIGGAQDEDEGEGKGKKKAAILTFGESNVAGHWAKVKLEKTENEKSGQDVTYPIKYATDTEKGRIWTELEIQRVAMIRKLLYKEKTSYIFIPPVLEKMRKEGLDVPDKIVGMPKLEAFFARPEVSDFWKKFIRELNENKELL